MLMPLGLDKKTLERNYLEKVSKWHSYGAEFFKGFDYRDNISNIREKVVVAIHLEGINILADTNRECIQKFLYTDLETFVVDKDGLGQNFR